MLQEKKMKRESRDFQATGNAVLSLHNLECSSCSGILERKLKRVPGIAEANVNYAADVVEQCRVSDWFSPARVLLSVCQVESKVLGGLFRCSETRQITSLDSFHLRIARSAHLAKPFYIIHRIEKSIDIAPNATMKNKLSQYAAFQITVEAFAPITFGDEAIKPIMTAGPIKTNTKASMSLRIFVNRSEDRNSVTITAGMDSRR
jgi:copper chaperone CopZ